eukprot:TRINITY_DN7520_c0_g3_i1.p1 TRINITY_DN7520_c0_g3~~TRINITY_DN7520_c0_g3_i1.p1  ORF type:complete len:476 (+),score=69.74 TRINITY_DN7520_c0_g3_i1:38-1429(+)
MGRLKRDREAQEQWPNSLPILADSIQYRLNEQESGKANWGTCLYPPDKKPCSTTHYFSKQWCVQPQQRPIPDVKIEELPMPTPPKIVLEQSAVMSQVEDSGFSDQDDDMIMRARALNISWAEIAAAFSGITQIAIKKRHQELQAKRQQEQQALAQQQQNDVSFNADGGDGQSVTAEGANVNEAEGARVTRMSTRINYNDPTPAVDDNNNNNSNERGTTIVIQTNVGTEKTAPAPRRGTRVRKELTNWWASAGQVNSSKDVDELTPVQINLSPVDNSIQAQRVKVFDLLDTPPPFNTVKEAHRLGSLKGVKFYNSAHVVDPDDPKRIFKFCLDKREHSANFGIGVSADGAPLLSYADLYAFYELPDATIWAEHGDLLDIEDLEALAKKLAKDHSHLIIGGVAGERELFKRTGRTHSRLQNIEMECYIFNAPDIPDDLPLSKRKESYYYKVMFNPYTLELVSLTR